MSNDEFSDFDMNNIHKLNKSQLDLLTTAYLIFSSKFVEYIRETDSEVFKRALDYAATVTDTTPLNKE